MVKVFLLKSYQEYSPGEIIDVSNNVAFGLVDSKAARYPTNKDYIVKSEFGETKAFSQSPNTTKKLKTRRF